MASSFSTICGSKFFSAFFYLLFKSVSSLSIVQRYRGRFGKHAQHIAVGLVEFAIDRVHIDVEVAGDLVLGDQWCNDGG